MLTRGAFDAIAFIEISAGTNGRKSHPRAGLLRSRSCQRTSEAKLATVESFGKFFRRLRLDAAQAQGSAKAIVGKPMLASLGLKALEKQIDLAAAQGFRDSHEEIG